MVDIITSPKYTIIEQVAVNCAAVWYEAGRGQGLTSKHKNAKAYAKANLEKFIPKAVEICLEMLGPNSQLPESAKMEVYNALLERHNDPTLGKYMPNIDVKRAIEINEELKRKNTRPIDIVLDNAVKTFKPKTDKMNGTSLSEIPLPKDLQNGQESKDAKK